MQSVVTALFANMRKTADHTEHVKCFATTVPTATVGAGDGGKYGQH